MMFLKFITVLFCGFTLISKCQSFPKGEMFSSHQQEANSNDKEWETKTPEISFLTELEKIGLGTKRSTSSEENNIENVMNSPPENTLENLKASNQGISPSTDDKTSTRVKKQSPNNVCIKIRGCGKTVCGPLVSAQGPAVGDVRTLMQNSKPLVSTPNGFHPMTINDVKQPSSKVPPHSIVQGRTVDLMGLAPTVTLGYGTPALYSSPIATASETESLGYGHSFIKPPSVPTVSAVPVAVITQHQPHPVVHPWLVPHLLPHVMPHLISGVMPSLASFVTPHRFEPQRFTEFSQNDFKQPVSSITPLSYASSDAALICQPVRNQRYDNPYDFIYKPDVAVDKSLNVSETAKKAAQRNSEDDSKIQDHLRRVNEIKEEISQLNRAAQRIVDQQEKMTEMQQKQLWTGSPPSSAATMHVSSDHPGASYMGSGYFSHPSMPWGYSRSNILSYPNTQDDINFFLNLLKAGKKFGVISDSLQPVISTVGEVIKGGQDTTKIDKEVPDTSKSSKSPITLISHVSDSSQTIKPQI